MATRPSASSPPSKKLKTVERSLEIIDLPDEMLLEIFEKMSLHELVVNTSKTSWQWRDLIAQYILGPKVLTLSSDNEMFKKIILANGWIGEHNDPELMLSLYHQYVLFTSKYLKPDCHYLLCSTMDFCSFRNQGAGLIWMEWICRTGFH